MSEINAPQDVRCRYCGNAFHHSTTGACDFGVTELRELRAEVERLRSELAQAQQKIETVTRVLTAENDKLRLAIVENDARVEERRADERRKTLEEAIKVVEGVTFDKYGDGIAEAVEALRRLRDLPPEPLRCQTCGEGRTHPNHAPTGLFRHDFWPQGVYR